MRPETLLLLHLRRAARKDAAVITHIGISRFASLFDHGASMGRQRIALSDARAVANDALGQERKGANDSALGVRHWRTDGAARRGTDGRWYETADLRPTARAALAVACATVRGSARPILSYSRTSDAALSAPTETVSVGMSANDTARRSRDDNAPGAACDALVNAARSATGHDIGSLASAFLVASGAWSGEYRTWARDQVFGALKACHRGKLRKALKG